MTDGRFYFSQEEFPAEYFLTEVKSSVDLPPGIEVIKLFSCSPQLSMKFEMHISIKISRILAFVGSDKHRMLFFPLINVKMPTTVGILTFMSRKNFMLS